MEKGFDVFISFKNTDKNGERTQDSIMAEELYHALQEKGFRAFFSNISISESGEHRFGKKIREALDQCSIFVAVGTSIENLQSKWVEYERESFHEDLLNGNKDQAESAMYSYITKNIPANRLPRELRRCQAFYELKDVVDSICARFQKKNEIISNFRPQKLSVDSLCPGTLVDGRYKIINKIGQGGMSVVYLAMNTHLNQHCAVKVFQKAGGKNFEVIRQSLLAEIEMLKGLDHPRVPKIIDVIDTKESFVLIMDFIEGSPLSEVLNWQGAQSEEIVVDWAKQLCEVLEYLHTLNPPIVYRDLKPANIMLKSNGQLALIDFGTARQYKKHNLADTTLLGTVGYAAPEQFGGMGQTDQRTDIYTLGVTLHHLVTGNNPQEPPYELYPIRQIAPQLSYGLEAIIDKCIRRNPEERYQSVAELRSDLENINKVDSKYRRKGIAKEITSRILGRKGQSQKKKQMIHKPIVVPQTFGPDETANLSDVLPIHDTEHKNGSGNKSALVNANDDSIFDKVAVCVSTKNTANVGDQVNIYFATKASKSNIAKLVASNQGYSNIVTGDRIIDICSNDLVNIRVDSEHLTFLSDESEFLWKDYAHQKLHEYFSFQIKEVFNEDKTRITVQLYVNKDKRMEIPVDIK